MKPMLAGKFPDNDKLKFPMLVQPKLDGIRCVIVNGQALTRKLKLVPNAEIQACLGQSRFNGLDGELIVGPPTADDCYRKTSSFVMSESKTGQPWTFYAFDFWDHPSTFTERFAHLRLRLMIHDAGLAHISLVGAVSVAHLDALNELEAKLVEDGYEGAILRGPDTLYKFGRGSATAGDLLKMKRFADSEAEIVAVEEEMHNGNEATTDALGRTQRSSHAAGKTGKGTMGKLRVRLLAAHSGFDAGTLFSVGTGFSAADRAQMWQDREALVGQVIRFKHFPVGAKDAPRHPVFQGIRYASDLPDAA